MKYFQNVCRLGYKMCKHGQSKQFHSYNLTTQQNKKSFNCQFGFPLMVLEPNTNNK